MRYTFLLLLFFCSALCLQAQQDPQNTFFMYNQVMYNPAAAGSKGLPSFHALYRQQWVGFQGAPVSQMLTFDAPLAGDRVGVGLSVRHFSVGITTDWRAAMAYSYKIQLTPDAALRFGVQGSVHYLGLDFNDADVVTDKDNDQSFMNADAGQHYSGNAGAGIYFNYGDVLWASVSVPSFYPVTFGVNNDTELTATEAPHFYGAFGGLFPASEKLAVKPSVLVKYAAHTPLDIDVNAALVYNDVLMIGLSYGLGGDSNGDNVSAMLGYQILHNMLLGAAYDYSLSNIKEVTDGSFEILLRYDVKGEKADLENPRFFK